MKTNLSAEEKSYFTKMLLSINEEDSVPMFFMLTESGIKYDNISNFELPPDVKPYRGRNPFSNTWINEDKTKWIFCRRAEIFRYNPSFLKFMLGMVHHIAFAHYSPSGFCILKEASISPVDQPVLKERTIEISKERYETSAEAFYEICDMPFTDLNTGDFVNPDGITFNQDYNLSSYYYNTDEHHMQYDYIILEEDPETNCFTQHL